MSAPPVLTPASLGISVDSTLGAALIGLIVSAVYVTILLLFEGFLSCFK